MKRKSVTEGIVSSVVAFVLTIPIAALVMWFRKTSVGSVFPNWLVMLLIGVSLLFVLASVCYQSIYSGRDRIEKPIMYPQVVSKLRSLDFISSIAMLILLWFIPSFWLGITWLVLRVGLEFFLVKLAESRALISRIPKARIWYPEANEVELRVAAADFLEQDVLAGEII